MLAQATGVVAGPAATRLVVLGTHSAGSVAPLPLPATLVGQA